jgi:DNA-directed RNA polymerase specialized sigma24 family protein
VNDLSDQQLLRDYAEHRSEAAFAELVRRHVDLVYAASKRMTADAHAAEDVTQAVFMALAQNAALRARRYSCNRNGAHGVTRPTFRCQQRFCYRL